MNQATFNKIRVAFVIQGCHRCRLLMEFIERINQKLPIDKRIRVVDCTYFQNYGLVTDKLIALYNKHFDGFPCIFVGNIKISGVNSKIEIKEYLNSLLQDDFIVKEFNDRKFNKECEFHNKGMFRGRIICK